MVARGSLIQTTEPEGISLTDKIAFLGMGFGYQGVPIDVLELLLAGLEAKEYSLLLVDDFLRFNGIKEEYIEAGLQQTLNALESLKSVYGFQPDIIISSDFMRSGEYRTVVEETEEQAREKGLSDKLMNTVPEEFRESHGIVYPLNEIACVEFLKRTRGIEAKTGPSKEGKYDSIMRSLGMDIDFAYLIDAYALGTKEPETVIPYIPNHRGKDNGQRIFLDDGYKAECKINLGPELALRYLLRLASVAGYSLGKNYLTNEEISSLYGRKLKKTARHLVEENILAPYREVNKSEG
ncbi:hypothetical protein CMO89_03430 [Candidatus Woesearchaeota archaeon]|nr:hypothetical protein [Candidatus Woesearchaeota archaeon]